MPIISGLISGLDTENIIKQLTAINQVPITRIENKKAQINEKISSWQSFGLKLLDLKVNATALSSRLNEGGKAVTSSRPDDLAVSLQGSPEVGNYSVKVNRLAQGELSLSQGFSITDAPVMTSGTLRIKAGIGSDDKDVHASTALSFLNNGTGISLGSIGITDRSGASAIIDISSAETVQDVLDLISAHPSINVSATLNDKGNGIKIMDETGLSNSNLIIQEVGGGHTAAQLGLLTPSGGVTANTYQGSDLDPLYSITIDSSNNTLDKIRSAINSLGGPFSAAIVHDGSALTPYRLSITSKNSGTIGALDIQTTTVPGGSLTFSEMQAAQDAEIELGSTTPLKIYGHTNQMGSVISGITLNLLNPTTQPVQISVNPNIQPLTDSIKTFISAYNELADAIHQENTYDSENKSEGGPLFGDVTLQNMFKDITRNLTNSVKGLPSTASSIFQIGIEPGPSGTLKVNEAKLNDNLLNHYDAVKAIFNQKTNVAAEATLNASSTTPGYFLSSLTDGDLTSEGFGPGHGWMGSHADGVETLEWSYSTPRYLSRAVIHTVDSDFMPAAAWGIRDYDLEALSVGGNPGVESDWVPLASVRGNLKGSTEHHFSVYTSRVRLKVLSNNANDHLTRLTEVQLDESAGASVRLNSTLSTLTNSTTGTLFSIQDTLSQQVSSMDANISRLNSRLAAQMSFLSKQFLQMEQALAQLQRSSSFLTAFSGISASAAASSRVSNA